MREKIRISWINNGMMCRLYVNGKKIAFYEIKNLLDLGDELKKVFGVVIMAFEAAGYKIEKQGGNGLFLRWVHLIKS